MLRSLISGDQIPLGSLISGDQIPLGSLISGDQIPLGSSQVKRGFRMESEYQKTFDIPHMTYFR